MTEKKPQGSGRSSKGTAGDKAEVRYFKGEEQFERWRREFVQNQDYEIKLAGVSKLSYSPVDYSQMLMPEPFPEMRPADYSYLLEQAKPKAEEKYFYPIVTRIVAVFCLLLILIIAFNPVTLLLTAALGVAIGVSLYFTIRDREEAIKEAEEAALAEANRRLEEDRMTYEQAKLLHDEKEEERINSTNKLLNGDSAAVRSALDEALAKLKLPITVDVDIDFHVNIPLVKVWLPAKTVILKQNCELLPSGRLQYQDKDGRVYNKQYFELCSAIILQIVLSVLAHIPVFQSCYAAGLTKGEFNDDCLLAVKVAKDDIDKVCSANNAIAAMRTLDAVFECDTSLALYPVEMLRPPEWEGIEQQLLKSVRIRIFKQGS